ncbi:hypothetical protein [Candidatus Nitrosocosmicus sp. T]
MKVSFRRPQLSSEKVIYTISLFILVLLYYNCFGYNANAQEMSYGDNGSHPLLINEISTIQENIENIVMATNEGNYSKAKEYIDEIDSSDNWFNVLEELQSRNSTDEIVAFSSSLRTLDILITDKNSSSKIQVEELTRDFNEIVNSLAIPLVDSSRLIITTTVGFIAVTILLYLIPSIRKVLTLKY